MDYSWALAAYDDTTLIMVPPFISSPSGERSDEFKVLSVHPAPNTPFNPNTSDYYSSDIYIRNLTASTRYTVSVVSTLGGNGSYATPCKTAPSDPLESEVVQFVACTAPPQPNVTWESYETSVTVTLHTPSYLFDDWKLEIFSFFNGTFREISLNSSQSAYTFDGLTYGVNYEIYVWLQIGGDVGLTDCGPVGAVFSRGSLLDVSAGCNSQPVVLHQIEAKSRWTISINFISFYYYSWESLVIVSSSSSLTNPIMNKTLDLHLSGPTEIDGLYPGTQYYLHFIQLVQFCPSGDRKFNDTTSACTIPDYINSSVT
ncbi:uncharacterized protein LOC134855971, partial [Symsagittifera roscoffensis]|uniref:uncharacterized protein LOC134855971 n=1 Tax=Symsagittifera roscoffensis TaxID=84072 RepID=UPI00307B5708